MAFPSLPRLQRAVDYRAEYGIRGCWSGQGRGYFSSVVNIYQGRSRATFSPQSSTQMHETVLGNNVPCVGATPLLGGGELAGNKWGRKR